MAAFRGSAAMVRNGDKSLGKKKGAKLLCIGTRPTEETHFFQTLLNDKSPDVFSLTYAADPEKDDPYDPATWHKANPGLAPRHAGIVGSAK